MATRKRRALAAGGVAVLGVLSAAAGYAVAAALDDRSRPDPPPTVAQRLVFLTGDGIEDIDGAVVVGARADGPVGEVLPDGRLVFLRPPQGYARVTNVRSLPDGRLAWLGIPGPPGSDVRPDGRHYRLTVTGTDGSVQLGRDVSKPDAGVVLLGGTDRTVYLSRPTATRGRPTGVVAHDLASGTERPLPAPGQVTGLRDADEDTAVVAVPDNLSSQDCQLRVVDLATGRVDRTVALTGPCLRMRLSPDTTRVAVTHLPSTQRPDIAEHLAVVDLRTGEVVARRRLRDGAGHPKRSPYSKGIAWLDRTTVRVAWTEFPPDADRTYPLAEVLRTADVKVP